MVLNITHILIKGKMNFNIWAARLFYEEPRAFLLIKKCEEEGVCNVSLDELYLNLHKMVSLWEDAYEIDTKTVPDVYERLDATKRLLYKIFCLQEFIKKKYEC